MKCKVVNVERVKFTNGTESNKVFAVAENGCMGCFFTTANCKPGSVFELSLSTDNYQKFAVKKELIQE